MYYESDVPQFLQQTRPCRRYTKLFEKFRRTEVYKKFLDANRDILELVRKESGFDSDGSLVDVLEVFDTLMVQVRTTS